MRPILTPEQIYDQRVGTDREEERYLRAHGWERKCDLPGAIWLWQRQMPDFRVIAVDQRTAVYMTEYWPRKDQP